MNREKTANVLASFQTQHPQEEEVFATYFGRKEVQQICDVHVGPGAQVQNVRFFQVVQGVLMPVYDVNEDTTRIHRADVTMWHPERPNSRTLLQLHRTESIDSYTFENQSQAYQIYSKETKHVERDTYTDMLYPRVASSLYYYISEESSAIVEWSITEDYDFSLYECIRDNADKEDILTETMIKVWALFKNMYAFGLVHGSMTPVNIVFNVFMQVSAKMLGDHQACGADRATISSARLTFLNNCLGAHQTVFVMHLYDVLVFLKSACRNSADLAGTCQHISKTICKGLSYLGPQKNFLVQPDISILPKHRDLGSLVKTELKGILVDQDENTLTEFPAEGCINGTTVKIDWNALNDMGNFIHAYIYKTDDVSTVSQVSNAFTQLIREDQHVALQDIMKHLAVNHPKEYLNKKIEVNLNDGSDCSMSFTRKEKKKEAKGSASKKKGMKNSGTEFIRPMGYRFIVPE